MCFFAHLAFAVGTLAENVEGLRKNTFLPRSCTKCSKEIDFYLRAPLCRHLVNRRSPVLRKNAAEVGPARPLHWIEPSRLEELDVAGSRIRKNSGPVKNSFLNNKNFQILNVDKILAFLNELCNYDINSNWCPKDHCYEHRLKKHKITIILSMIANGQNVL